MELIKIYLFMMYFMFILLNNVFTLNNTEKLQIVIPYMTKITEITTNQNKTIDKLVQEQTELIKKIVSDHKATTSEYPIVTKKEITIKDSIKLKEEKEQQSIEELRRKCHELFKQWTDRNRQNLSERPQIKESVEQVKTVEAFGPQKRPEFLQNPKPKPEIIPTLKLPPNCSTPGEVERATQKQPLNYFILTRNRTTSVNKTNNQVPHSSESERIRNVENSQGQTVQHNPLINYVQLEPLILQRMFLNNGKMLIYWYRNLPMTQYVPNIPTVSLKNTNIHNHGQQILNGQEQPQYTNLQTYLPQITPTLTNSPSPESQQLETNIHNINQQTSQYFTNNQAAHSVQVLNPAHSVQILSPQTQSQNINLQQHVSHTQLPVPNAAAHSVQILNSAHPIQILNPQTQLQNINSQQHVSHTQLPIPSAVSQVQIHPHSDHAEKIPEKVPHYEITYDTTKKAEDDSMYKKQMKFVIPVPYPTNQAQSSARYPWQFDPFAYYPKQLQPSTINVPLAYQPTFHMIRTLSIPEEIIKANNLKTAKH